MRARLKRVPRVSTAQKETLEQFLARGGEIEQCPNGNALRTMRLSVDQSHGVEQWQPVMNAGPYGEWSENGRQRRRIYPH